MAEAPPTIPYMMGRVPNRSQVAFAGYRQECKERYYLGTPACGKTTALFAEVNRFCQMEPGATWLLARWTELEAASVLKGDFEKETPPEWLARWDHEERRWYYRNGSSVYIHGLKPAEGQAQFSKFAGYNLSGVALSQVEGIDTPYLDKLFERLRNPKGPRLLLAEGNIDVTPAHWMYALVASGQKIAERVYLSGPRLIIIGNLADNEANLPPEYVEGLKRKYPVGHPEYGPKIAGTFGVVARGEPVYGPLVQPNHILDEPFVPSVPLIEAWDFGISRPAVLWSQWLPGGRWRVLGEWMGQGTALGEAVRVTRALRGQWFPQARVIWRTADPTGENRKDTGPSSIGFLRSQGLPVTVKRGANQPGMRTWAIQQLRDLMQRTTLQGPAFGVHPRCATFIDGLKAGYVRDPNRVDGMPMKDGYFDHLQNAAEYSLLTFYGAGETVDLGPEAPLKDWRDPGEPADAPPRLRQTGY